MAKATHNGTCQACGRDQAVRANGLLAKHGYTVDFGFFNGTCHGSDHLPLEHDTKVNEFTVERLRKHAETHARYAAEADTREKLPVEIYYTVENGRRGRKTIEVTREEFADIRSKTYFSDWDTVIRSYRSRNEYIAKNANDFADRLVELREHVHGQDLKPRDTELTLHREEFDGKNYAEGYSAANKRAEEIKAAGVEKVNVRRKNMYGFTFSLTYRAPEPVVKKEDA
jgi:hypothetical protein